MLHAEMLGQAVHGNPFWSYCLKNDKFGKGIPKEEFKSHHRPHVLPRDGEKGSRDDLIPLEEWDEAEERWPAVVNRLRAESDQTPIQELATDGGGAATAAQTDADLEEAEDLDRDDPADDEEPDKGFQCPMCGHDMTGEPEECDECPAEFGWDT